MIAFVEQLKQRTKRFAIDILILVDKIPDTTKNRVIKRQITKSGTSVGANYRAACRARSNAEFFSKMSIAVEECDETIFGLEIIIEANILPKSKVHTLITEGEELVKIFSRSRKTAKRSL